MRLTCTPRHPGWVTMSPCGGGGTIFPRARGRAWAMAHAPKKEGDNPRCPQWARRPGDARGREGVEARRVSGRRASGGRGSGGGRRASRPSEKGGGRNWHASGGRRGQQSTASTEHSTAQHSTVQHSTTSSTDSTVQQHRTAQHSTAQSSATQHNVHLLVASRAASVSDQTFWWPAGPLRWPMRARVACRGRFGGR